MALPFFRNAPLKSMLAVKSEPLEQLSRPLTQPTIDEQNEGLPAWQSELCIRPAAQHPPGAAKA